MPQVEDAAHIVQVHKIKHTLVIYNQTLQLLLWKFLAINVLLHAVVCIPGKSGHVLV